MSIGRKIRLLLAPVVLPALILFGVSCRSLNPPPAADLSAPGWRTLQGQAVWKPSADRPELAGDLLLATNLNGDFFVQFTKTPFPLVTAESLGGQWQIKFGADEHSWRGRGLPPARFAWFQLPQALLNPNLAGNWTFKKGGALSWRLFNRQTGETLEGGFFP